MSNVTLAVYIEKLVTEKGRDFNAPLAQFEKVGHHDLSYATLAEFSASMPVSIQEDIRKNLTNLDFHNADIFDYLDHLLNGMIVATGMNQYGGLAETKLGDIVME